MTNAFNLIESQRLEKDLFLIKAELNSVYKQIKPANQFDISLNALAEKYNSHKTNKKSSVSDELSKLNHKKELLQRKQAELLEEIAENELKIKFDAETQKIEDIEFSSYAYSHDR